MKSALGCAINTSELLRNFPLHKLKLDCKLTVKLIKRTTRLDLVSRIFKYCFKLVINDIIENNITFNLPLVGKKKARIEPSIFEGDYFNLMYNLGSYEGLDYIASDFKMYGIQFVMAGNRTPRRRRVYISKAYKDKIIEKANQGFVYGGGRDTVIQDYFDKIMEKYKGVTKQDLRTILNYCWRQYYMFVSRGCDILIRDKELYTYTGSLKYDPKQWFDVYRIKLALKIRWLNKTNKDKKWDGYYYFVLSEDQYQKTFGRREKKRGRPLHKFTFENVYLYTYYDECSLRNFGYKYICRIPYKTWIKNCLHFDKLTTSKAELITIREPLKFKDILISENEYDLL